MFHTAPLNAANVASLASVRAFAAQVREVAPAVQALVLNAAVVTRSREVREDGLERQRAVNHHAQGLR